MRKISPYRRCVDCWNTYIPEQGQGGRVGKLHICSSCVEERRVLAQVREVARANRDAGRDYKEESPHGE